MTRVPASLYDALKASAEQFGGIGARKMSDEQGPCCLLGHLRRILGVSEMNYDKLTNSLGIPQYRALTEYNDSVVTLVNIGRGESDYARVPWDEYVRAMQWERGE